MEFPVKYQGWSWIYWGVTGYNFLGGSRGWDRGSGPPSPGKSQKYRGVWQYWSGLPGKSQCYQASIPAWAIIGRLVERHYGVSLPGDNGPRFLSGIWILSPPYRSKKEEKKGFQSWVGPPLTNFMDPRMGPLRKKMHCRKQFSRTASEYSANTLRLLSKHNLIWLTSIRGMFARCSLFTCKLGLPRTLPRIFREHAFKSVD